MDNLKRVFDNIKNDIISFLFSQAEKIPAVRRRIESEINSIVPMLEKELKPYSNKGLSYTEIPEKGIHRETLIKEMERYLKLEKKKWEQGYVSGAVYHGGEEHIEFLNEVYALQSQSNPLHADVWPSTVKFEAEVVAMTARMLRAPQVYSKENDGVCGTVTSGGSESIMLAMKTYRDKARKERGITKPEMVLPVSAHVAFHKAAEYFNIKMRLIPLDKNYQADLKAVKKAINRNTVVVVGSAPTFPHGVIDPIEEMSTLALEKGIGFHTDACLGGFILPWIRKAGYHVPDFDFQLPGVTSISVDTHKYGFAAKGTSIILYKNRALRRYQFFTSTDWPGGLYFSPTFAGSRPGGLSAACWAAMVSTGEEEYIATADKIVKSAEKIKDGINAIPELEVMGAPLYTIAFTSKELDIYRIMEFLSDKGWGLNGLHKPSAVHICLTKRHTSPAIAKRFIKDLNEAVDFVKTNPSDKGAMAPVYGLAATLPSRDTVSDILSIYMDILYRPD